MIAKLLTEHLLKFLRGSFESKHFKMPHCWKSHATAHLCVKQVEGGQKKLEKEDHIYVLGPKAILKIYSFLGFKSKID